MKSNINGKKFGGLWNTRTVMSLVDSDFIKTKSNDIKTEYVETFIGKNTPNLT